MRAFVLMMSAAAFLASCAPAPAPTLGPDGKPLPRVYQIRSQDEAKIEFRMLDSVNQLRAAAGAAPVQFSAQLNAAAATHSRDMSVQNRPWHFGSDGSSPVDRARRVGYPGEVLGENISETYETELETLSAWMEQADTRAVITDARARNLGFAWFQEPNGKIWWTLLTGT